MHGSAELAPVWDSLEDARAIQAFHHYLTQTYGPTTITICPPEAVGLTLIEVVDRTICIVRGSWLPRPQVVVLSKGFEVYRLKLALEGLDPLAKKAMEYLARQDQERPGPTPNRAERRKRARRGR